MDWPSLPEPGDLHTGVISTFSGCGLAGSFVSTTPSVATAWPAANDALFVPFRLPLPRYPYRMAIGTGTGTTGNFDAGIYDVFGNRLCSTGSTARSVASEDLDAPLTTSPYLAPGQYYLALALDSTALVTTTSAAAVGLVKLAGIRRAGSAFPLPASVTFATANSVVVPLVACYLRSEA